MIATVVYLLCALTALACAVLLLRAWSANRVRLLLWAGLCFVGLALNNLILLMDAALFPAHDLTGWRTVPAVLGMGALLWGLVWESPR